MDAPRQHAPPADAAPGAPRRLRIVLVDDDEVDRRVVMRHLERSGLPVHIIETADPHDGLRHASDGRCDCILLDYRFPVGNAFELFAELLSATDEGRPGIVVLSGVGDERIAAEAIQRGAQEYLPKTQVGPSSVRRAIESAIAKVGLQRQLAQRDEQLQRMSFYDALTELPNRRLFHDRLDQAVRAAERAHARFAVMMMDLDLFKAVNDAYGHAAGDELLRMVATRLQSCMRESDTVARLGGDEFAAVLPTTDSLEGALVVAAKIRRAIDMPFFIDNHVATVGIALGVAMYPEHGQAPDILLRKADMAMYVGKHSSDGQAAHSPEGDDEGHARALIAQGLKHAVARRELFVHYQPQIRLANGAVVGVEALVRWHHPQLGDLSPARFIPAAERSEAIMDLTLHVIDLSLAQNAAWRQRGRALTTSVNLSARLLDRPELAERIVDCVRRARVAPSAVCLEITETAFARSPENALATIAALTRFGIQISIDDFGTGYSSFSVLRNFPAGEIKIDQSFVRAIGHERRDTLIVKSILALGQAFGARVIAEGIEDAVAWRRLQQLGCEFGQGFAIARPMSAQTFDDWIDDWETKHPSIHRSS